PDPNVSIFNFHYAAPPATGADNYHLNRPLGDDETGFDGNEPEPYRLEGWDFILAGGAIYDNLDYSFTVGHEDGTAENNAPGDGGPVLRSQLEILKEFIEGFRFIHMQPDSGIVGDTLPDWITVRALREEQKAYAIYINGDGLTTLDLQLPDGRYSVEWVNTNTGETAQSGSAESVQNSIRLSVPSYTTDIALRLLREA
ncbi:MAG TPA: hypothetical protein VKA68_02785, partial [bacterium]|nr:hypothetical protein [bacterium]